MGHDAGQLHLDYVSIINWDCNSESGTVHWRKAFIGEDANYGFPQGFISRALRPCAAFFTALMVIDN